MPNLGKTSEQIEAETNRFLLEQAKAFAGAGLVGAGVEAGGFFGVTAKFSLFLLTMVFLSVILYYNNRTQIKHHVHPNRLFCSDTDL